MHDRFFLYNLLIYFLYIYLTILFLFKKLILSNEI